MSLTKRCVEKVRLLRNYQKATVAFSVAVAELCGKIGIVQIAEYQQLIDIAEKCRLRSADALDRLELHSALHGC